jgi:hypothetical protein
MAYVEVIFRQIWVRLQTFNSFLQLYQVALRVYHSLHVDSRSAYSGPLLREGLRPPSSVSYLLGESCSRGDVALEA